MEGVELRWVEREREFKVHGHPDHPGSETYKTLEYRTVVSERVATPWREVPTVYEE